jgi:hypothetical protein
LPKIPNSALGASIAIPEARTASATVAPLSTLT